MMGGPAVGAAWWLLCSVTDAGMSLPTRSNEENAMMPTMYDISPLTSEISVRARAEYLEMPGLQLTAAQAARLFNLAPDVCAALLDGLVGAGFLHRSGTTYIRADSGRRHA